MTDKSFISSSSVVSFRSANSRSSPLQNSQSQPLRPSAVTNTPYQEPSSYANKDSFLEPFYFHGIVGCSQRMAGVLKVVRKVSGCDATVLLQGESGTGKEVIARAIHHISPRRSQPFVIINCSTIVDTLMESELFGHERGSFTGAIERKAGKFEVANRGTVFLDEISELPLPLQPKLLRIIQEKEFTRVGGAKPLHTDIRIIAATNRDISAMVQEGLFRQDLFYRLKVIQILVPPLRERLEDIPILVKHFMKKHARRYGRPVHDIEGNATALLKSYSWPGNVRDLEHVIERAVVISDHTKIQASDIAFEQIIPTQEDDTWDYSRALRDFHRDFLIRALSVTGGNKRKAASMMGISHAKLYRLLGKLGIKC